MRRKIAAAFALALASAIIYPLFYEYMVGPSIPGPLQGLVMITFGFWLVFMVRNLLGAVTRPAQRLKSKDSGSP